MYVKKSHLLWHKIFIMILLCVFSCFYFAFMNGIILLLVILIGIILEHIYYKKMIISFLYYTIFELFLIIMIFFPRLYYAINF